MRIRPCEKAFRWLQDWFRERNLIPIRWHSKRRPLDLSCDLRRDIGLPCLPGDPSPRFRNYQ